MGKAHQPKKFPFYNKLELFVPEDKAQKDIRKPNFPGVEFVRSTDDFTGSFFFLATYMIRIDGAYQEAEFNHMMNYAKKFGISRANQIQLKHFTSYLLSRKNVPYHDLCTKIAAYVPLEDRMHLFHFLCELAHSDGKYLNVEHKRLQLIGFQLGLQKRDMLSVVHAYLEEALRKQKIAEAEKQAAQAKQKRRQLKRILSNRLDSAFKVLGLSPNCSDEELKSRYRKLVKQHHPDRFATLGEVHIKKATERFKAIQEAYEKIEKSRN